MSELSQEEIKYYSKSNLKSKCRYRYANDHAQSKAALRGEVIHVLNASYLLGVNIERKDAEQACDVHGLTKALVDDVFNAFSQWKKNKGDIVLAEKEIICVESNDAKDFKYGKKITKIPIDDKHGLQGMFDLVCIDKKTGMFEVIDWKSGHVMKDDPFENIINGMLAYRYYNLDFIVSTVYSIPENFGVPFTITKGNFEDCMRLIDNRIAEIEAEEAAGIKKTVNQYCSYCSLKSECDEYKQLLESNPPIRVPQGIKDGMAEVERLKIISSAVNAECDAISNICKAKLEQQQDDGYELVEEIRFEYPAQEVYNTLSDMGYKPDSIIKVNKTDLDELLGEIRIKDGSEVYKTVREIILALRQEKTKIKKIKKKLFKS